MQNAALYDAEERGRTKQAVGRDVFADRAKGLLISPRGERKDTVLLGEDSEPRNEPAAEHNRRRDMVDLGPGNLNVILWVSLVVELEGAIPNHDVAVFRQPHEHGAPRREVQFRVQRLRHSVTFLVSNARTERGAALPARKPSTVRDPAHKAPLPAQNCFRAGRYNDQRYRQ